MQMFSVSDGYGIRMNIIHKDAHCPYASLVFTENRDRPTVVLLTFKCSRMNICINNKYVDVSDKKFFYCRRPLRMYGIEDWLRTQYVTRQEILPNFWLINQKHKNEGSPLQESKHLQIIKLYVHPQNDTWHHHIIIINNRFNTARSWYHCTSFNQLGPTHSQTIGQLLAFSFQAPGLAVSLLSPIEMPKMCGDDIYHTKMCANDIYHTKICADDIYHTKMCGDDIYHTKICADGIYHTKMCGDGIYHTKMCADDIYHTKICADDIYHTKMCADDIYHTKMCGDDIYHTKMCGDGIYHTKICAADINHTKMCGDGIYHTKMCADGIFHTHHGRSFSTTRPAWAAAASLLDHNKTHTHTVSSRAVPPPYPLPPLLLPSLIYTARGVRYKMAGKKVCIQVGGQSEKEIRIFLKVCLNISYCWLALYFSRPI